MVASTSTALIANSIVNSLKSLSFRRPTSADSNWSDLIQIKIKKKLMSFSRNRSNSQSGTFHLKPTSTQEDAVAVLNNIKADLGE